MKKVFLNLLVAGFVSVFAVGCSKSMPECGDSDVTDLLESIVKEQLLPMIGIPKADINKLKFKFSDFLVNSKDEGTKKVFCSASVKVTHPDKGSNDMAVNYSAQYTEDGKVYVQILE